MEIGSMPFLLVTANVGSVFEDPSRLLKPWIKEFLSKVALLRPLFLALHLQEVGGKTYEKSMDYVQDFIKCLCESEELIEYSRIRIYIDEDFNSAEHFTALGNIYFIHQTLNTVKIWNFLTHEWENAEGKCIYTGNIETIATKEKAKFPQHFFPECKWSRKGFLRTRWEVNCTVIDLVNIHLFHDASNLAACEEFPSVYCKTRRRALVHTLERFHTDIKNGLAPYFLFGDFNFRCDTEGVIKKLTEDLTAHRVQNVKNDNTKVQYRNSNGENVLTVGKKEFNHSDHQTKFKESWLQQFDRELEPLREVLVEYPITFPPSYPYEEDPLMPKNYMSTRCPAWCDRILMSPSARDLIVDEAFSSEDYNLIGENVCMGDHKPVFLSIHVKTLQGTIRCCICQKHANPPNISEFSYNYNLLKNKKHVIDVDNRDVVDNMINDDDNYFRCSRKNASSFHYCLYSSIDFNNILFECRKLNSIDSKNNAIRITSPSLLSSPAVAIKTTVASSVAAKTITTTNTDNNNVNNSDDYKITDSNLNKYPIVSINVTDTDNCMCPIDLDNDENICSDNENNKNGNTITLNERICSQCRNIIKKQPIEHRCTLISKRLMLTNNIIVNRIDTHYLNTFDNRYEPYTPESAESHSPVPEIDYDDNSINNISLLSSSDTNLPNNNIKSHHHQQPSSSTLSLPNNLNSGKEILTSNTNSNTNTKTISSKGIVSPKQLKIRLENLQRRSSFNHNEVNGDDESDTKKNSKSIRYNRNCCVIC